MTSGISLSCTCHQKGFSGIAFVPKDHQTKALLHKIPEPFPVIHRCRGDLKCRDIAFQRDQGMDLEAEISLFFGRTFPIICPVYTERTAITRTPKLADRERKAVNHKMTAGRCGNVLVWMDAG